ncbi:MAG: NAD+ synthase [Nitrospirae bacterium CG08_land_8_20_14_0_20_52_24]|nr:MAG: NAD+ synthase [Nitrospirae bacterium CG08_land_8_20_14_0_20_52_24]
MRCLRVGMAQINPVVGDLDGNRKKMVEWIRAARKKGVQLLSFPELAVTGYPPKDLLLKPDFIRKNLECLQKILPETKGICVIVGFVDYTDDLYNAAAVLHDGQWIGTQHKILLPNYDVFDEHRYFRQGAQSFLFDMDCALFGVTICEDIWFPDGPAVELARNGAELVVNISASPFHAGKAGMRREMIATRARDHLAVLMFNNMVGGQDDLVFDGRSLIADQQGHLISLGKAFEEDLIVSDLNLDDVRHDRLKNPRNRRRTLETKLNARPLTVIASTGITRSLDKGTCRKKLDITENPFLLREVHEAYHPYEEVYSALKLGLSDYARKNGFRKVVIGISGGIDSALTAALAVDAIGADHVIGVSMPSRITSRDSVEDAKILAGNLGIRLKIIPIHDIYDAFAAALSKIFKGKKRDVTEENIQARIRGVILMALSNKFGYLVISTGNKSEVGVGYATLYGDMAGGLALISDVPKTLVYKLADYRNSLAEQPVIPERIMTKPPSAELSPGQKDSDTLPDYEILDGILHAYVELDESASDIVGLGYDQKTVRRIIRMIDKNEYKRQQAALGIRITPRAFGSGRRLPITNKYSV